MLSRTVNLCNSKRHTITSGDMMSESSADECKAKHLAKIPSPLSEIYHDLFNEISWLHVKWIEFRKLFASDPKHFDLFNKTAASFFYNLKRMMWDDLLLHMCRITDKASIKGKATRTLDQLQRQITDECLKNRVNKCLEQVSEKLKFARDYRNRRLAHREFSDAKPLPEISRNHVTLALSSISDVMNVIANEYMKVPVSYEHSIECPSGADALILYLEKGLLSWESRLQEKL